MSLKSKSINLRAFVFFCAVLLLSAASFQSSHAYEDIDITAEEQAVFSYFRAIGKAPDYNFWITTGHLLDNVDYSQQEEYILNETIRLGNGFGQHDQSADLMGLKFRVIARYISGKKDESGKHVKPRMTFRLFNNPEQHTPSFSYEYGQDVISMVVEHLEVFSDIPLGNAQNQAVLEKLPVRDEDFEAVISLKVRASDKTTDKPLSTDHFTTWLMIGEISHLQCSFENESGEMIKLWDYVAPWYKEQHRLSQMSEEEKSPHPYDLYRK